MLMNERNSEATDGHVVSADVTEVGGSGWSGSGTFFLCLLFEEVI